MSSKIYQLEKPIWTHVDFEKMSWHDCMIYAVSFGENDKLYFDIDYIFKWVQTGKTYKFWVSPCTMIFENVYDIEFQIDSFSGGLQIDNISRENPQRPPNADFIGIETNFSWNIETLLGSLLFKSVGYTQYVRRDPKFIHGQYFDMKDRGGISFKTEIVE